MPRASPTSKAAKPVVPLILPVTAGIVVEDSEPDDMLGVFEAELGRNAHAHGKAVFRRQDFSVVLEGQLCLWMQRRRHIDGAGIALGANEMHILCPRVGANPAEEFAERRSSPFSDRTPALDADEPVDLRLLGQRVEPFERPRPLVVHQTLDQELVIVLVDVGGLFFAVIGIERKGARDRAFWIGRREPVRIEQPGLYAIIEAGHDAQRVLRRWAIDDVAAGQKREGTEACTDPQKVAASRLAYESGGDHSEEPGVATGNRRSRARHP